MEPTSPRIQPAIPKTDNTSDKTQNEGEKKEISNCTHIFQNAGVGNEFKRDSDSTRKASVKADIPKAHSKETKEPLEASDSNATNTTNPSSDIYTQPTQLDQAQKDKIHESLTTLNRNMTRWVSSNCPVRCHVDKNGSLFFYDH